MGRHRTPLHAVIATLCVALAVVFAGASASSVLDGMQHEAQVQHQHGLHLGLNADDGHHDHDAGDHQDTDSAGDHQPGIGHHHHSDAPSGALDTIDSASLLRSADDARLSARPADPAKGVGPGGLERPPRTTSTAD